MELYTGMFSDEKFFAKEGYKIVSTELVDSFLGLQIALCDDDEMQLKELQGLLETLDINVSMQIKVYSDAKTLLTELQKKKDSNESLPDVIFCDVKMPGMDGISFGKELQRISGNIYLVLLSSYVEFAVQGYETRAFRYVVKPVTDTEIKQILLRIMQERSKQKKLIVRALEGEWILSLSDIIYLSSEDKYTFFYTEDEHYVDRTSLNDYEQMLAPYGFYRIHRKYIVNLAKHKSIGKGKLLLSDGTELSISRRREVAYKTALLHYLEKDLL